MIMLKKISKVAIIIFLAIISINAVEFENREMLTDFSSTSIQPIDNVKTKKDSLFRKEISRQKKLKRLHRKNLKLQKEIMNEPIRGFEDFLNKLAWRESRGDWKVVNRFGYAGKYQIGKDALTDLNYSLDLDLFKTNPRIFPEDIQDSLVIELIKLNRKRVSSYIKKYSGKIVNQIKVTESGILAASHLLGSGNVRKWLDSNGKFCPLDGNGVSIEEYLVLFSKYKININS